MLLRSWATSHLLPLTNSSARSSQIHCITINLHLLHILQRELKDMAEAGVVGFKCFLCPSGVDEFPNVTKQDVEASLKELEGTNSVLAVSSCKSTSYLITLNQVRLLNPLKQYKYFQNQAVIQWQLMSFYRHRYIYLFVVYLVILSVAQITGFQIIGWLMRN